MKLQTLEKIWEANGVFDLMEEKYREQIEEFYEWKVFHSLMEMERGEDGAKVGKVYLGQVQFLCPSQKYTNPLFSEQNSKEVLLDKLWHNVLEEVANKYNYWIEFGDDPCDIFICSHI